MSPISKSIRATVIQRASACCEYCLSQARFSPSPFSIEHILPVFKGGTDELSNLALSCQACNNHKFTHTQALDNITGRVVLLYNPRQNFWNQHFVWTEKYSIIMGISPIGRATVEKLQLNRSSVVNLRQALCQLNLHPPFN